MIHEIEEYMAYTTFPAYTAKNKYDSTYLGRFTYDMLLKFEGLSRVLTILARKYAWETETPDPDRAYRALQAWCSIPDSKIARPKRNGQSETDFRELCSEFPELVGDDGGGWFYRHVHNVVRFVEKNPNRVMRTAVTNCDRLKKGFDAAWRDKLMQMQVPLFSVGTKGAWLLRFDDVIADAVEEGPLRGEATPLSDDVQEQLRLLTPKGVPESVLPVLVRFYVANRQEDSEWVVLPVANFDAYFGTTSFSRKWLPMLPEDAIERSETSYGVSRFKLI